MKASSLHLRAVPPLEVIKAFEECAKFVPGIKFISWELQTNLGDFSFQNRNTESSAPISKLLTQLTSKKFAICSAVKMSLHERMTYIGEADDAESIEYSSSNGIVAFVRLFNIKNTSTTILIIEILEKHLTFLSPHELLPKQPSVEHELSLLQLREEAVTDLHSQLVQLGNLLTNITQKDVELRKQRLAELEAGEKQRAEEFERERNSKLAEDERQRKTVQEALQRKEAELDQRIAEFETRESKFVRRDLLAKLTQLLDEFSTFKLSDTTAKKRRPVTWAAFIMTGVFAAMAVIAGYDYLSTLDWHYLPMASTGVLGFSATMLFYLKWSDRWFREHADEELQSKRYKADMLRASWIAELAAEWEQEGKQTPKEILEVFARNLFVQAADHRETEHPADAILGLMKRAQKLDVSKDRVTLEASNTK